MVQWLPRITCGSLGEQTLSVLPDAQTCSLLSFMPMPHTISWRPMKDLQHARFASAECQPATCAVGSTYINFVFGAP